MKTILTSLFILFVILFPNRLIGTYEIIDEISDDILEVKKDGTYTYNERGDSCWLWNDFSGEWRLKNKILTLFHLSETVEDEFVIEERSSLNHKGFITIVVRLKNGNRVSGLALGYYSVNKKALQSIQTDTNGIVKFVKNDIVYNVNDNSFIDIVGVIDNKKISTRLIFSRNSDELSICVNLDPKSITRNLKHKFKIEKGLLISLESLNTYDDKTGKIYKKR